jgi:hypothetical protein
MESFVMRLWLPDRPGALGQVASRIGAVRGDVVGIDILERGAGRAIDELVVQLPSADLLPLLVEEVGQVDGVDVEEVRPVADALHDPRLDALETAAILVGAGDLEDLVSDLCVHGRRQIGAEWIAVVDPESGRVEAVDGPAPHAAWLLAFVAGSQSSARVVSGDSGPDDVLWAPMPSARLALVAGRTAVPFRARERRQAAALCRIADTRWRELLRVASMRTHPSSAGAASPRETAREFPLGLR